LSNRIDINHKLSIEYGVRERYGALVGREGEIVEGDAGDLTVLFPAVNLLIDGTIVG
jgi:hypothetical protein